MNTKTIEYLIIRTANLAIGNSTLRNQGAAGVTKIARDYLATIDLKKLTPTDFNAELDRLTDDLKSKFPAGAQNFGAARKAINIYLRDCLYNKYINKKYSLDSIQNLLEVPLDSHVANGLRATKYKTCLPQWDAIIRLTKSDSDKFQKYAECIANDLSCNRVDLDIYLWRQIGKDALQNI